MRERFGTERVGLSTGDASIQTDSAIMIMTTEILRNIMYRTEEEAEDKSTNRDALADVGLVVLDEVSPLDSHSTLQSRSDHGQPVAKSVANSVATPVAIPVAISVAWNLPTWLI